MAVQTMPSRGIIAPVFELQRVDMMAPENGGSIGSVQIGWPRWVLKFSLTGMSEETSDEWRSFISQQKVPGRRFFGRDPSWSAPKQGFSPPVSAWSFEVVVDDEGDGRPMLEMDVGEPNLILTKVDYIGFQWVTSGRPRRSLHRVVETAISDLSGILSVEVEPAIPSFVPSDALAVLQGGDCIMRLTSETEIGEMDLARFISARIVAVQELLP